MDTLIHLVLYTIVYLVFRFQNILTALTGEGSAIHGDRYTPIAFNKS